MSSQSRPAFDAAFWFQWIVATTVGWVLGRALFPNIPDVSGGVGVSVLQWPVLYGRLPRTWRWTVASAAAWIAGTTSLFVIAPTSLQSPLGSIVLGLLVGFAQWLILRRELRWAGWWIIVSAVAWSTGLTLIPGILSTGALAGALTGVALILLSRNPASRPINPEVP